MAVDILSLKNLGTICTRDDDPRCVAACPIGVDAKGLMARVRKGDFELAYKHFRTQAVFPLVVAWLCDGKCTGACVRAAIDEGIRVGNIERSVCQTVEKRYYSGYYIPPKKQSIAVIGGGLGGMTCALRLSRKGYPVTVYEASDRVFGRLWESGKVPKENLEEEASYLANEKLTVEYGRHIRSLQEISADAVYVATGLSGDDFGLRESYQPETLGTSADGVFLSSKKEGSTLTPMRDGMNAARAIEKYLMIYRVESPEGAENAPTRLFIDTTEVQPRPAVAAANGDYSREEAVEEAERCLDCSCTSCFADCELLTYYAKSPKKVVDDVNISLNPLKGFTTRLASRQIQSCNLCGRCREMCPHSMDFEALFEESRAKLIEQGVVPPAFHEFWLNDMAHSLSDRAHFAAAEEGSGYAFFPGCRLGSSHIAYVEKTYDYLREKFGSCGILLSCCGAPALWAGETEKLQGVTQSLLADWEALGKPKLITACPSCKKMLSRFCTEIPLVSLYDILGETGVPGSAALSCAVFDSCASRGDEAAQKGLREALRHSGAQVEELKNHGDRAQCCGFGGHMMRANPLLYEKITENRSKASEKPYAVSCANCRDAFAEKGKAAFHVLDLLAFGEPKPEREPPSLTERRLNREELRDRFAERFGKTRNEREGVSMKLSISPELEKKMDRLLILRADAERTILHCETTQEKLLDRETGNFVGHLREGSMTYWVRYQPEGEGFRLLNIYAHRMKLEVDA